MKLEKLNIIKKSIDPNPNGNDLQRLSALLAEGIIPNHDGNLKERIAHLLSWGLSAQEAVYRATHPGEDHSNRLLS